MAIKVGGTNVITDARALNNISSIDTTTKNAISNAGVGGLTTVLVDNGSVNGSRLSVDFTGGYDRYIISLSNIRPTSNYQILYLRLKNSSGSDITTGDKYIWGFHHTNSSNGYRDVNNYVWLQYNNSSTGYRSGLEINVWYPYSTSRKTYGNWNNVISSGGTPAYEINHGAFMSPNSTSVDRHNGCYMYFPVGNIVGDYSVWGVNN